MTITLNEVNEVAPSVPPKAQEKRGVSNPFVSLQSLESLCQGNETLEYCLHEMVVSSLRYTEAVCRFEQIRRRGQQSNENGERAEIESLRTAIHDATIDAVNLLSRNMKKAGQGNDWVSKVSTAGRAGYMAFAIRIAFEAVLTLNPQKT